jgi:thiosulfate/3-mercaptopyruvate sulfurtransferase
MDCRVKPGNDNWKAGDSSMTSSTDDPLVSTDWLAAHIDDPKVRIIDASFKLPGVLPLPADDYLAAHLPGAVFFDVDHIADQNDSLPHMYPDAAQFARDIAALGISNSDTVVAYDSGGWVAAPRAWWMLLSFGHANVKVLDGGLQKWLREGRPTHSGKVTPKPGKFQARLDSSYLRSQQQLVENLETHAEQLIDARPRPRFEGSAAEPRPGLRGGHIPGSRSVPYAELFDAGTGAMKPLEELRKAFTSAGVDLAKPIVTTCGSGVSALVLTLALYRLGVRGSALYDGSWSEWGLPDGPSVATGPA